MSARIAFSKSASPQVRTIETSGKRGMRTVLLGLLIVAGLVTVVSCGSRTSASTTSSDQITKLALGTLDLEDTDQAVNASEAARLLPLWELLNQLETSGSAAPAEIKAVLDQIQLRWRPRSFKP